MTPEQMTEVWQLLDRARLAELAQQGPPPVFATISGAHLYGFASPDSDVDLRGAFLLPARALLGLKPPAETLTVEDKRDIELDWVAHDLRKFARLMTQHNGYVLEQLYSPLVVLSTPAHEELCALGRGCLTRGTVRHYRGFFQGRRKRLAEPHPTVKHLLYAYRVVLTGIHLMDSAALISNIQVLNERFRLPELDELVARKRAGAEVMALGAEEVQAYDARLDALEAWLVQAHEDSQLPEQPTTVEALNEFVVRLRLEQAR